MIHDLTQPFDFGLLALSSPFNKNGGYFIKFSHKENPVYVQPPKCLLKQGFVKSGKKMFCDLVFSNEDEKFVSWLESLEETCRSKIFENRAKWFENDLDEHDIENYMTPPYKIHKKQYVIRCNIPTLMDKCELKVYNENEMELDYTELSENTQVITILEFKGIKCSVRSFMFDIEVKQMLVVTPMKLFDKCLISSSTKSRQTIENSAVSVKTEADVPKYSGVLPVAFSEQSDLEKAETVIQTQPIVSPFVSSEPDLEKVEREELKEEVVKKEMDNVERKAASPPTMNDTLFSHGDVVEITDFELDEAELEAVHLRKRDDVYYKMYKDAKRKAQEAKLIALSNYLEAKRIKSTFLLNDEISDEEDEETMIHALSVSNSASKI